ncbi:MAG: hypothetical protein R3C39_13535 [Dehalococcoidia bacterium]
MMRREVSVTLPLDDEGMLGRQCPGPLCGRYFKVKPDTGHEGETLACPYCGTVADPQNFATEEQIQYATDVAAGKFVDSLFDRIERTADRFNRQQRGGLLNLQMKVHRDRFVPRRYTEHELETGVTCDNCGLEFAVYGVFASCPDCQRLNALTTCLTSLEVARKRVRLSEDPNIDADLRRQFPRDALRDSVAAFDSYGKALRAKHPGRVRSRAKTNLFQDLDALDVELLAAGLPTIETILSPDEATSLKWFFQARHVYEHNAGVVDDRFVNRIPEAVSIRGQLLPLPEASLLGGVDAVDKLARALDRTFPTGAI